MSDLDDRDSAGSPLDDDAGFIPDPYPPQFPPAPAPPEPGGGMQAPGYGYAGPQEGYGPPGAPAQDGAPGAYAPGPYAPGPYAPGQHAPGQHAPAGPYGPYGPQGMPAAMPPGAPFGIDPATGIPYSDKSKIAAGLLSIFLGFFGVGRFYMGHTGLGLAQLLVNVVLGVVTLGFWLLVSWIWPLVDGIVILAGQPRDGQGRPLR